MLTNCRERFFRFFSSILRQFFGAAVFARRLDRRRQLSVRRRGAPRNCQVLGVTRQEQGDLEEPEAATQDGVEGQSRRIAMLPGPRDEQAGAPEQRVIDAHADACAAVRRNRLPHNRGEAVARSPWRTTEGPVVGRPVFLRFAAKTDGGSARALATPRSRPTARAVRVSKVRFRRRNCAQKFRFPTPPILTTTTPPGFP